MSSSTYTNIGLAELAHTKLTVELANRTVKHPKGITENVLVRIGKFIFPVDFIILDMPEDVKVPLILKRPFLSTAHPKIDMFKRKITLRISLRERMELDLEGRLMGEDLILNRSLDLYEDYIELNDLNEPLELRRNQFDDRKIHIYDFVVVENMDSYHDEGIGNVIVGRPFCKEACIKSNGSDGMITICKENDSVSAQDELKLAINSGVVSPLATRKPSYGFAMPLLLPFCQASQSFGTLEKVNSMVD
ncbi:hypothetical protein Tco_0451584 [Tanacetum coccineum]